MKREAYAFIVIIGVFVSSGFAHAQNPANYICDKLNGTITGPIEGRDFIGTTYKCNVNSQWDMLIQGDFNEMVLDDNHIRSAQKWKKTYIEPAYYNRRTFSFNGDKSYIANIYVPFERKTSHFYISQQ